MKKRIAYFLLISSAVYSLSLSPASVHNAEGINSVLMDSVIGKSAPDFTLVDISGNKVELSSFKGKHVLLNFWATWCGYCRKERAHLNALYEENKDKGLVIIAVSTDRSPDAVREYLKKIPSDFIVVSDKYGDVASLYNVGGLPTSFLIDSEGVIKHKFMGYREWSSGESKEFINRFISH